VSSPQGVGVTAAEPVRHGCTGKGGEETRNKVTQAGEACLKQTQGNSPTHPAVTHTTIPPHTTPARLTHQTTAAHRPHQRDHTPPQYPHTPPQHASLTKRTHTKKNHRCDFEYSVVLDVAALDVAAGTAHAGGSSSLYCQPCPAGSFSTAGAASCTPCTADPRCAVCSSNTGLCSECATGYALNSLSVCALCAGGYGQTAVGSACTQCTAGTFRQAGAAVTTCTRCVVWKGHPWGWGEQAPVVTVCP
jgi:hypothetical protein